MISSIIYGFTVGAILYFFSIGLSITFGTMHLINFTHALIYTLGVYVFISLLPALNQSYILAAVTSCLAMVPLAYLIERFVIRRLYGESLDYVIVATYALLLIGTDLIKIFWGTTPYPVRDPIASRIELFGLDIPVYRLLIVLLAFAVFFMLKLFFKRTLVGKIVVAAMEDKEGVLCLGIDVSKYFGIMFVIGSTLAVLGGILYSPISTADPYMGFHILLLAFAVVIVGGMGNLTGTFWASMLMGLLMALVGRFYSQGAQLSVFILMAIVLLFRKVEQ